MKLKIFFSGLFCTLIGIAVLMQTSLLALAVDPQNPITSVITNPITEPIITPSPLPSPSPITTPTPEPTPAATTVASLSSGGTSYSFPPSNHSSAPVCGDSRPMSAPKLLSALANGKNQVLLAWSKALDPVSYYLVAYGTKPGLLEYGNPNVGDKNTTSYQVKNLDSGKTYYFRVRAGNGCMPGESSNEIAVKVSGKRISGSATGFQSGVLGSEKQHEKDVREFKPIISAQPARAVISSVGLFTKILNFIISLVIH